LEEVTRHGLEGPDLFALWGEEASHHSLLVHIQPTAPGIENLHAILLKIGYRLAGDHLLKEVAPRAPRCCRGRQFVVPKAAAHVLVSGSKHHLLASYSPADAPLFSSFVVAVEK